MGKSPKKHHIENKYKAWPGSADLPTDAESVPVEELNPETFWKEYVSQRKPVLISGFLTDEEFKAPELWTDEYLTKHAGDVVLEVEERKSTSEGYGKGRKVRMTFGECLRRMAAGDATLYLTTQKVEAGIDGHPEVYGHPVQELAGDLPVQPALLGNLIPQQINIWAGCAPEGSSSGLHHDYHDNLYVLLRGKKRFRLYPPSQAERMYVHGELAAVHPNGRIVHKSQGEVLADGSEAKEVAQWEARRAAELELKEAEEAVRRGEEGAQERLAAAEAQLDEALDAALDVEGEGCGIELLMGEGEGEEEEEELGDEDEGEEAGLEIEEEELLIVEAGPSSGKAAAKADTGSAGDPDSFSRIDLSRPAAELHKEFPLFPGADAALVCEVSAGQMLYVPAGWFHEVSSFSTLDSATHMALNYWCHPPDHLEPSAEGFKRPYRSDYWPEVWAGRVHMYVQPKPSAAAANGEEAAAADTDAVVTAAAAQAKAHEGTAAAAAGGSGSGGLKKHKKESGRKRGREEAGADEEGAGGEGQAAADEGEGPRGLKARLVEGARQLVQLFDTGRRQLLHKVSGALRNVRARQE